MRYALMIEAQMGLTYADQLAIVRRAEAAGFEAFFRSDHYASFPGDGSGQTTDAWTVLAGLARDTDRIHLGVLVSPVTFRHPGNLAKVVTTVDEMSGGRIEVGVGAGWNAEDHARLGLAFPPIADRADLLEDELALLHGLWTGPDGWSFDGRRLTVRDALFRARPVDLPGRPRSPETGLARPNLITGGTGSPRSLRIAARWTDEYNVSSSDPDTIADINRRLDEACRAADRDPSTVTRSAMAGTLVGRDAAEVQARQDAMLGAFGVGDDADAWFAERRPRWIHGTPDEARAAVARFEAAGVQRLMFQDFLPHDLEMIDRIAETFGLRG